MLGFDRQALAIARALPVPQRARTRLIYGELLQDKSIGNSARLLRERIIFSADIKPIDAWVKRIAAMRSRSILNELLRVFQDGVKHLHPGRHFFDALHDIAPSQYVMMPAFAVANDVAVGSFRGGVDLNPRRDCINLDDTNFALLSDDLLHLLYPLRFSAAGEHIQIVDHQHAMLGLR